MKLVNFENPVTSEWLHKQGSRLDANPFLSGAVEAKITLEELPVRKDPLHTLTRGHNGGIYNGPQFRRNYVTSPEHGVPFFTSGSILRAELSSLPLLSKKDARSKKLAYLKLKTGMTLITCSGSIGRTAYARPEMDGMWSSQDVMKVVPDEDKILPGYLYAYLSSRYGVSIITSGTYGAVIQHIEPEHIADLPVPRLGEGVERRVHELMQEAANLLSDYQKNISDATARLFAAVGLKDVESHEWHEEGPDLGFAQTFPRAYSFRALNYNSRFKALTEKIRLSSWCSLGEICLPGTLKRGGRFKRIDAEPEHAYQLVGQRHLFWLQPEGRWIAKSSVGSDVLVEPGTILVAAQGTLGESELYCRAEFAWGPGTDLAYSEHILRVIADEEMMPRGCLYAFMRSETAFRMLRSISVGTKLQDHHYAFLPDLPVPYPSFDVQQEVHELVVSAYEKRHTANSLSDEAIRLVERGIEQEVK